MSMPSVIVWHGQIFHKLLDDRKTYTLTHARMSNNNTSHIEWKKSNFSEILLIITTVTPRRQQRE